MPLCLTSGCIGFFNGYMAHPPREDDHELRGIRNSPFPALAADGHMLAHSGDHKPHPVGHALLVALILADVPVSAAIDGLFLPFRLIALGIHGPPESPRAEDHDRGASRSGNVRPSAVDRSARPGKTTTTTTTPRTPTGPVYTTQPPDR